MILQSFLKHVGDALRGELAIVDNAFRLKPSESLTNVVGCMDGGEYFVEYATRLNVFLMLSGLFVIV